VTWIVVSVALAATTTNATAGTYFVGTRRTTIYISIRAGRHREGMDTFYGA
jgi:hypothetical protein